LSILVHGKLPDRLLGLRISKLNWMVDIYAVANRLNLHTVMNVVLDPFSVDVNSNAVFPSTLLVDIYQKTEKESGLRKWFIEPVTVSVDVEDFEELVDHWPAEAFGGACHVLPFTICSSGYVGGYAKVPSAQLLCVL
jgi:hypothetical protein